ncbi:MAG: diacylglycerol/lipid kinase family protein, partial [Chloroflexota bacterium]
YIVRGVSVALSYRGRRVTVDADGMQRRFRALLIVIGNTRRYGGPVSLTPEARIDDGLFDVCVFRGVGLLHAAWYVLQVLIGRHTHDPGVVYFRTKRLMIRSERPLLVQVDGDTIGETPMGFVVRNRFLKVIVPSVERPDLFGTDEVEPVSG